MSPVVLRPMTRTDLPLVSGWLDQPHVRRWWVADASDVATLEKEYGPRIDGTEPTEMFVICVGQRPIGFIQRYLVREDPAWVRALSGIADTADSAGIDYLIGEPDAVHHGFGTESIRMFVPTVFDRWPVSSIVVAVQLANRASWRALERAGFTWTWSGTLDSEDPADAGPAAVYVCRRPGEAGH